MREDLIERLQGAAEAYPEDVFGKTTDEDRRAHGDVVQRAAATMGRHMAPLLREAAAALEAAREDAERMDWLSQLDVGICHLGFGDYQWYAYAKPEPKHGMLGLRQAIDQARGKGVKDEA